MKKQVKIATLLLTTTFLFSCHVSIPVPFSYEYPSYSSPYFDFNPIENGKRKLIQIQLDRQFSTVANQSFDEDVLDQRYFSEDKLGTPFYRPSEQQEAVDLSEEPIVFLGHTNNLEQFVNNQNEGPLSEVKVTELLTILDSNDDVINKQEATFKETDYSKDYLNGAYYAFNNYHKEEQSLIMRYTNNIVQSEIDATIYYQDGFKNDYTALEQIWSDGFKIYEIHEEKFPIGSTNANNYKLTSDRVEGNFKEALQVSGGARAKRFIETIQKQYDQFNEEIEINEQKYAYQLTATKTNDQISLVFHANAAYHLNEENQTIYDTEIIYEVVVQQGIVSHHHISQIYWAPSLED